MMGNVVIHLYMHAFLVFGILPTSSSLTGLYFGLHKQYELVLFDPLCLLTHADTKYLLYSLWDKHILIPYGVLLYILQASFPQTPIFIPIKSCAGVYRTVAQTAGLLQVTQTKYKQTNKEEKFLVLSTYYKLDKYIGFSLT